jgi:hypothetical protein
MARGRVRGGAISGARQRDHCRVADATNRMAAYLASHLANARVAHAIVAACAKS